MMFSFFTFSIRFPLSIRYFFFPFLYLFPLIFHFIIIYFEFFFQGSVSYFEILKNVFVDCDLIMAFGIHKKLIHKFWNYYSLQYQAKLGL